MRRPTARASRRCSRRGAAAGSATGARAPRRRRTREQVERGEQQPRDAARRAAGAAPRRRAAASVTGGNLPERVAPRAATHRAPHPGPPGRSVVSPPVARGRALRISAWALVAAGVAAPALRRRARLPKPAVAAAAWSAPVALCVALPRSRRRDVAACLLQMWAYVAMYEMPNDDPEALRARVRDRLPGPHRPRDRLRRAARRPPPAPLRAAAGDPRAREAARLGALDLVRGPARHRAVRARAPPRAVPARRGADLRDVRPRRPLLLDHPDRAALVRRAGGPDARRGGRLGGRAFTA